jgi:hypothetical protein
MCNCLHVHPLVSGPVQQVVLDAGECLPRNRYVWSPVQSEDEHVSSPQVSTCNDRPRGFVCNCLHVHPLVSATIRRVTLVARRMSTDKAVAIDHTAIRRRACAFIPRKHVQDRSERFPCNCLYVHPLVSVVIWRVTPSSGYVFRQRGIEVDWVQFRDDRMVNMSVSM